MDIFVGSLSFKLKESELREAFEKFGMVSSAKIIIDKITRQSKGFGFVEMPNEDEARLAISSLNGADMYGRALVVNESQKREPGSAPPPRSDFKREGGYSGTPRTTDGDSRPASPPGERPAGGYAGGGSSPGGNTGGGRDFGPDKHKGGDRKFGGNDRNKSSKPDSKFGRASDFKKGGGGSKNYRDRPSNDDDSW